MGHFGVQLLNFTADISKAQLQKAVILSLPQFEEGAFMIEKFLFAFCLRRAVAFCQ